MMRCVGDDPNSNFIGPLGANELFATFLIIAILEMSRSGVDAESPR